VSLHGVVHVVDDDTMFRSALTSVIELAGHETRSYASAGNFLLEYQPVQSPQCLILDLQLPGPNGLALCESLARSAHPLPVIFLSGFGDVPSTVRAMRAGAIDFLTKPVRREVLLPAIAAALAEDLRQREMRERLASLRSRLASLSPRETAVYQGVIAGKRNKQIAAELNMAERTVKTHRSQLMAKMNAGSIAKLAELAFELQSDPDAPRLR
jgi:FixJ family two-component response regulator